LVRISGLPINAAPESMQREIPVVYPCHPWNPWFAFRANDASLLEIDLDDLAVLLFECALDELLHEADRSEGSRGGVSLEEDCER